MAATASSVGKGFSFLEIIALFGLGKTINSMWILLNALQFLVYIYMWNVRVSPICKVILVELKRITMGEYLDDLQIGNSILKMFGIEEAE